MQTINGRDTSGTLSGGQVSYQPNNHAHLIQTLSAIMSQVNALQALGNEESLTSLDTLRQGLTTLEQLTRDALYELRPFDEQTPLAELLGVTLTEALSRLVEETAETLGLSSRLAFSGEEHALSSYAEGLLYRIAQETLHHVQQHE